MHWLHRLMYRPSVQMAFMLLLALCQILNTLPIDMASLNSISFASLAYTYTEILLQQNLTVTWACSQMGLSVVSGCFLCGTKHFNITTNLLRFFPRLMFWLGMKDGAWSFPARFGILASSCWISSLSLLSLNSCSTCTCRCGSLSGNFVLAVIHKTL